MPTKRKDNPGVANVASWSAWDILASLGDSLAVVDTSYRVVWAKEPLLPQARWGGGKGQPGGPVLLPSFGWPG